MHDSENHYHYHYHYSTEEMVTIIKKLDRVLELLTVLKKKEDIMSAALDALKAAVAENTALDQSAIDLINGLAAQILSLKEDPAALEALAVEIQAKSAALAAAIQANTPQA